MPRRVKVIKSPYTLRDTLKGLTGVVKFMVTVASNSYLHIGSGKVVVTGLSEEVIETVRKARDLEGAIRAVKKYGTPPEHQGLVKYGDSICIPGSSIKGAVRSRLELGEEPVNNSVISCFRITSRPPLSSEPRVGLHGWRHARIWWDAPAQDRGRPCNPAVTGDYSICRICDIFGAPGIASRVFFGNACISSNEVKAVLLSLDHGERLEAVPQGTVFKGEFSFTALRPEELGLIFIGMGGSKNGSFTEVLMGKSRYRVRRDASGKPVDLGRVVFGITELVLKGGTTHSAFKPCSKESGNLICREDRVKHVVSQLVNEAISKYPMLSKLVRFSEVRAKERLGGG